MQAALPYDTYVCSAEGCDEYNDLEHSSSTAYRRSLPRRNEAVLQLYFVSFCKAQSSQPRRRTLATSPRAYFSDGGVKRPSPPECFAHTATTVRELPVVLLGLHIGCTLVLSGLLPLGNHQSADHDGGSGEARTVTSNINLDDAVADLAQLPLTATPERRQLVPTAIVTPSPTLDSQDESGKMAVEEKGRCSGGKLDRFVLNSSASQLPRCPLARFDPVLARLVCDNSISISASSNVESASTPPTCQPQVAKHGEDSENKPSVLECVEGDNGETVLFSPEQSVTLVSPEAPSEGRPVASDGDYCIGGGRAGKGKARMALKEEVDVPDEEWRRWGKGRPCCFVFVCIFRYPARCLLCFVSQVLGVELTMLAQAWVPTAISRTLGKRPFWAPSLERLTNLHAPIDPSARAHAIGLTFNRFAKHWFSYQRARF